MRLGELLVAAKAATAEQVTEALRAQVLYGGRLGTNLVELGIIDLEQLSEALATLQHRPAALGKHFGSPDRALQRGFAADLAYRHACVPLFKAGTNHVIIATIAPLDPSALAEVAASLEVEPERIVATVAPELRIRYYLERDFHVARDTRFLRVRGKVSRGILTSELFASDVEDTRDEALAPVAAPDQRMTQELGQREWMLPAAPAPEIAHGERTTIELSPKDWIVAGRAGADKASNAAVQVLLDAMSGPPTRRDIEHPERRTYLATLAENKPRARPRRREAHQLELDPMSTSFASVDEATRSLRNCHDREQVARVAIQAVTVLGPSDTAILLNIRGQVAVGWTGCGRGRSALPEIVVPLDQPGLIATAMLSRATVRAEATSLSIIDTRLFDLLGGAQGELVAAPITLVNDVICVIATVAARNAELTKLDAIAAASGAAFLRLLRNADR